MFLASFMQNDSGCVTFNHDHTNLMAYIYTYIYTRHLVVNINGEEYSFNLYKEISPTFLLAYK